jgi:hypothetical protein
MDTTLLNEFIDPLVDLLNEDTAQKILAIRPSLALQQRSDQLAEKANRGELSYAETTEYNQYIAALYVVSMIQARARRLLKDAVAHG